MTSSSSSSLLSLHLRRFLFQINYFSGRGFLAILHMFYLLSLLLHFFRRNLLHLLSPPHPPNLSSLFSLHEVEIPCLPSSSGTSVCESSPRLIMSIIKKMMKPWHFFFKSFFLSSSSFSSSSSSSSKIPLHVVFVFKGEEAQEVLDLSSKMKKIFRLCHKVGIRYITIIDKSTKMTSHGLLQNNNNNIKYDKDEDHELYYFVEDRSIKEEKEKPKEEGSWLLFSDAKYLRSSSSSSYFPPSASCPSLSAVDDYFSYSSSINVCKACGSNCSGGSCCSHSCSSRRNSRSGTKFGNDQTAEGEEEVIEFPPTSLPVSFNSSLSFKNLKEASVVDSPSSPLLIRILSSADAHRNFLNVSESISFELLRGDLRPSDVTADFVYRRMRCGGSWPYASLLVVLRNSPWSLSSFLFNQILQKCFREMQRMWRSLSIGIITRMKSMTTRLSDKKPKATFAKTPRSYTCNSSNTSSNISSSNISSSNISSSNTSSSNTSSSNISSSNISSSNISSSNTSSSNISSSNTSSSNISSSNTSSSNISSSNTSSSNISSSNISSNTSNSNTSSSHISSSNISSNISSSNTSSSNISSSNISSNTSNSNTSSSHISSSNISSSNISSSNISSNTSNSNTSSSHISSSNISSISSISCRCFTDNFISPRSVEKMDKFLPCKNLLFFFSSPSSSFFSSWVNFGSRSLSILGSLGLTILYSLISLLVATTLRLFGKCLCFECRVIKWMNFFFWNENENERRKFVQSQIEDQNNLNEKKDEKTNEEEYSYDCRRQQFYNKHYKRIMENNYHRRDSTAQEEAVMEGMISCGSVGEAEKNKNSSVSFLLKQNGGTSKNVQNNSNAEPRKCCCCCNFRSDDYYYDNPLENKRTDGGVAFFQNYFIIVSHHLRNLVGKFLSVSSPSSSSSSASSVSSFSSSSSFSFSAERQKTLKRLPSFDAVGDDDDPSTAVVDIPSFPRSSNICNHNNSSITTPTPTHATTASVSSHSSFLMDGGKNPSIDSPSSLLSLASTAGTPIPPLFSRARSSSQHCRCDDFYVSSAKSQSITSAAAPPPSLLSVNSSAAESGEVCRGENNCDYYQNGYYWLGEEMNSLKLCFWNFVHNLLFCAHRWMEWFGSTNSPHVVVGALGEELVNPWLLIEAEVYEEWGVDEKAIIKCLMAFAITEQRNGK